MERKASSDIKITEGTVEETPGGNLIRWSKEVQRERREKGIGGGKIAEVTLSDSLLIDSSLQCQSATTCWSQRQSGTQTAA